MVKKNRLINSKKKINKLKRKLMTTSDSKISTKFKSLNNARIGKLFEKNIYEVLKIEYGWKIPKIQRHFF